MSSVKRSDLKAIVKELLVEILSEGLGAVDVPQRQSMPGRGPAGTVTEQRKPARRGPVYNAALDTPVAGRQASNALKNAVMEVAQGNPMMQEILAHTAMTSLPQMLSAPDHGMPRGAGMPGDNPGIQQQEQFNGTPEQVFGDGASRWADLAFMEPKKQTA